MKASTAAATAGGRSVKSVPVPLAASTQWDIVADRARMARYGLNVAHVRELVETEDHKDPLNDDQIVALLTKEGIDISRRTVAKYREALKIAPANLRKAM